MLNVKQRCRFNEIVMWKIINRRNMFWWSLNIRLSAGSTAHCNLKAALEHVYSFNMNATFIYERWASLKTPSWCQSENIYLFNTLSPDLSHSLFCWILQLLTNLSLQKSCPYLVVIKSSQISFILFSKRPPPQ